ncbi:MAG TPA: AAA family ATPase [Oligoflexia bacterium]|nr:AAA family ATPase [Oligoflexia bacterium]HMP47833.1 AAA family ATPase [Oligoflexia bacterium]
MSIDPSILKRILEEQESFDKTINILKKAEIDELGKLSRHSIEARSLTSEIVNSRRDIEKQMLANDESVSHSLSKRARSESKAIEELLDSPYFARLVLEEETHSGIKSLEYKIGKRANIDARIIDWKNAPLARLFYEYQEGENYLEEIRGQERSGKVVLRNKILAKGGILKEVDCPLGRFKRSTTGEWEQTRQGGKASGASSSGKFELPSILSLISPEQFSLITEEATEPVILHGIAGSGKTSVALHRLAWQLARETEKTNPIIIAPTELLSKYIKNSLESLDTSEITIITRDEWLNKVKNQSGLFYNLKTITNPAHPKISRVKSSIALTKTIHTILKDPSYSNTSFHCPKEVILYALRQPDLLLEFDSSRLLDHEMIKDSFLYTKNQFENGESDQNDTSLILLSAKIMNQKSANFPVYSHLFLDEFQEVSPVELAFIGSLVKNKENITMTGDIEQHTTQSNPLESAVFQSSMDAINLTHRKDPSSQRRAQTLTISHRSSFPIMKYADSLLGQQRTTSGRPGKPPLLVISSDKEDSLKELILWTERVGEKFSNDPILVLSRNYSECKELKSLISPTLGERCSLLIEAPRETSGMILLASINQCKGLEFPHVGIWNVSREIYPPTTASRRELYLAATRAEEHLTIFVWGQHWSQILPGLSSKLHRIYDVRSEKEDNEGSQNDLFG